MKSFFELILLSLLILGGFVWGKQNYSPNPRIVSPSTGRTAGEFSSLPADVTMTKKIRYELLNDSQLSAKAKKVEIIVLNSGITLKGMVENEFERAKILEHAYISAPKHRIYNQISIKK